MEDNLPDGYRVLAEILSLRARVAVLEESDE